MVVAPGVGVASREAGDPVPDPRPMGMGANRSSFELSNPFVWSHMLTPLGNNPDSLGVGMDMMFISDNVAPRKIELNGALVPWVRCDPSLIVYCLCMGIVW